MLDLDEITGQIGNTDSEELIKQIRIFNYVRTSLTGIVDIIVQDKIQKEYQKYISEYRKMKLSTIEKAKIFYILNSDHLFSYVSNRYDMDLLGFSRSLDNVFRERFLIPIMAYDNNIIGVSGYDYESEYKYLNSKTAFFDRRFSFFNENNIKYSYKEGVTIVVEGLFDSLRLNEIGFRNNLASMGTSLFHYHRNILKRTRNIMIPDNDEAGIKAMKKWSRLDDKLALVRLPKDYKDIDKFCIEKENAERFTEVYTKIINDMKSPFFKTKDYYL